MPETILVVDDEAANRDLLEAILSEAGYRVLQAEEGKSAISQALAEQPDLVLLDLLMPGMNGFDVSRRLRRDPATAGIPILVVTALGQIMNKEAALFSGADDFVMKPINPQDIRARVAAILKVRMIRRDLDRALAYLHELEAVRWADRGQELAKLLGSARPTPDTEPPRIAVLLVEDEPLTRGFYGDLLGEHGFRVWTAASGPEALEAVRQRSPETVILDTMLPEMSGFEVLEHLQSQDPDLPVIMLTSQPSSHNALVALKAGAFDFLVKGLAHELVVLAVHRAVRHRRQMHVWRAEVEQLRRQVRELRAGAGSRAPQGRKGQPDPPPR